MYYCFEKNLPCPHEIDLLMEQKKNVVNISLVLNKKVYLE